MDLRKIKKLIDLLEESNLAEIEIKEGEESVRLARTPSECIASVPPSVAATGYEFDGTERSSPAGGEPRHGDEHPSRSGHACPEPTRVPSRACEHAQSTK